MNIYQEIARRLGFTERAVEATIGLLDQGATIPFISRYRKEHTGSLDEVEIRDISTLYEYFTELQKRKEYILGVIEAAGALTDELRSRIDEATEANVLEDIYLPFKPKRRTRATVARERGLEPLAKMIMAGNSPSIAKAAARFVTGEVTDAEAAIAGAKDIIAEWVSEHSRARDTIRRKMQRIGTISCKIVKGKDEEAQNYRNYDGFSRPLRKVSSHQYLAMRRGEREGLLRVGIDISADEALEAIDRMFVKKEASPESAAIIRDAVADGYKRLLLPSIENEIAAEWKKKADEEAITLFADNLRQLLL